MCMPQKSVRITIFSSLFLLFQPAGLNGSIVLNVSVSVCIHYILAHYVINYLSVSLCLLTVATSRRKALTLSVISAPAADPSTAEGGGAGDLVVRSHGREGLTQ